VCDAHVDVVRDDRQVINRHAGRPQDDEVLDLLVIDFDTSADVIRVRRLPRRHLEPNSRLDSRCFEALLLFHGQMQARAVVLPCAAGFFCRVTLLLQAVG
jgi:hypothetical protein